MWRSCLFCRGAVCYVMMLYRAAVTWWDMAWCDVAWRAGLRLTSTSSDSFSFRTKVRWSASGPVTSRRYRGCSVTRSFWKRSTHTHTHTPTPTHTHAHAHSHTHRHTDTHTHSHSYSLGRGCQKGLHTVEYKNANSAPKTFTCKSCHQSVTQSPHLSPCFSTCVMWWCMEAFNLVSYWCGYFSPRQPFSLPLV